MYDFCKRTLDVVFGAFAIFILSPLFLWLALRIHSYDRGPVLYRAKRVGVRGKPFTMYKFRSMVSGAEKRGASSTADDDPRITPVGNLLRKYKLDELPQLFNVVKGDMSFVGPRPQVQWAVDLYTPEQRRVLAVRPGITDYSSLHFPNEGEILKGSRDPDRDYMEKIHPKKMTLSLRYVEERSMWVDLKLMAQTVWKVFKGSV